MQITSDHSRAAAAAPASPSGTSTSTTANPADSMANEQTFLKLLVAQVQNQDPMQPTDSMQFVGQLAQFSSLEQLIGIHQTMTTLSSQLDASTAASTTGSTGTNPAPGQ